MDGKFSQEYPVNAEVLKALLLVLHFSYYTLMSFLMMLWELGTLEVKSLKNTCEGVHLLKLLAISLQAWNFSKNELHTYFSRILARCKLLFTVL